jgi:predicted dehydrogenase
MCDVGVHLVDFVTWVTGLGVISVGAVANPPREQRQPEEHIVVDLELANGALATIDAARSLPNASNALEVHGSVGSLYTGPLRWVDNFTFEVRRADDVARVATAPANAPLRDEMVAVRDALAGKASDLLANAEDGREGAAVLEAVIQSLETKRRVSVIRR